MKKDIHPKYQKTLITCACGTSFTVGSTAKDIHIEICSACHPFYTGKQKLIDTARRVERFQEKAAKAKKTAKKHVSKTSKRAALKAKRDTKSVKTKEEISPKTKRGKK